MPAPLYGQIAVSATAQPLAPNAINANAYTIKTPTTNQHAVFIGDANVTPSNGHQMDAGDIIDYVNNAQNGQPTTNLRVSDFYVVGTTGDKVTWLASP